MPSIFKSLLGGSAKSQSSSKKLKKGASVRSQRPPPPQPAYDRHSDDGGSTYSGDVHAGGKHPEFVDPRVPPLHREQVDEHLLRAHSSRYPNFSDPAAPRIPHNMPRYELYDRAGPGPLPLASLHQAPSIHEPYPPVLPHMPGAPSVHHYPNLYHPPPGSHPDTSWQPIPDVHRESTIVDPEAYRHEGMRGYDSEEERWMRSQEESIAPEGYGRFVAPSQVRSDHRSVHREEIVPHHGGPGDWEWADNHSHAPSHARRATTPHPHNPLPVHSVHREDLDAHRQHHPTPAPSLRRGKSVAEQHSHRLSTGSGSKFQEHLVSPDHSHLAEHVEHRPSLKKKLSKIFSSKSADVHDTLTVPPSGGVVRSHSRASVAERKKSIKHIQVPKEPDRDSIASSEESWKDDAAVFQYIVPAGVNVIFKDKHGNEITRVGDYPDSAQSKRRGRRSAPIMVIDQHGKVLYDDGAARSESLRSSSPRSAGSGTSSHSAAKAILISPTGEQFHLGGSATSGSSVSGSQRGRKDHSKHRRR